jgi:hypothetical protein
MWFSHQLVYATVGLLFDFVITSAASENWWVGLANELARLCGSR